MNKTVRAGLVDRKRKKNQDRCVFSHFTVNKISKHDDKRERLLERLDNNRAQKIVERIPFLDFDPITYNNPHQSHLLKFYLYEERKEIFNL